MRCIADTAPRPTSAGIPHAPAPRLRLFQASDIPSVTEIVAEALREHYDASLYLSLSQQWPDGFLVAMDERGGPVGFLLGVSQVEREARILMFAVHRDWRTRGVGTALMSSFFTRCKERGYRRITLEVRVSNATAIRFYTRFQFSVVELLRGYYSDGENGYQMSRTID
ncbi:MAG: GNAT family N-acetyltransferase [Thermoplasmata archaeon]